MPLESYDGSFPLVVVFWLPFAVEGIQLVAEKEEEEEEVY